MSLPRPKESYGNARKLESYWRCSCTMPGDSESPKCRGCSQHVVGEKVMRFQSPNISQCSHHCTPISRRHLVYQVSCGELHPTGLVDAQPFRVRAIDIALVGILGAIRDVSMVGRTQQAPRAKLAVAVAGDAKACVPAAFSGFVATGTIEHQQTRRVLAITNFDWLDQPRKSHVAASPPKTS
jgi:hypothetical protein